MNDASVQPFGAALGPLPGISVILPVFWRDGSVKAIRRLRAALASVAIQACANPLEVVLVDDGSSVEVASLAAQLGVPDGGPLVVQWVRHPANRGLVAALNTGLRAARYPLIARLDADDQWCEGKLASQLALFTADPELSITATGMARVHEDGSPLDTHIRPGHWDGILRFFIEGGCPFPHGSVLARRDVFLALGGYPHDAMVRHCEDYALWGSWLRFFKPAMVEAALYRYTVSTGSLSGRHADQQAAASQLVRRRFEILELAEVLPRYLPLLAEALRCSTLQAGLLCYVMWQNPSATIALPEAAQEPLWALLPDRVLEAMPQAAARPWWDVVGMADPGGGLPLGLRAGPIR